MGFLKRSFNKYIKCYYVLGTNLKIYHYFFKALYYTGNRSVALATNWIFDHPELDLETPLGNILISRILFDFFFAMF